MVHAFPNLCPAEHKWVQVGYIGEVHRRLFFVGNYDFRCASPAEGDSDRDRYMVHVVCPRFVLGYNRYLDGTARCGKSPLLFMLLSSQVWVLDNAFPEHQWWVNLDVLGLLMCLTTWTDAWNVVSSIWCFCWLFTTKTCLNCRCSTFLCVCPSYSSISATDFYVLPTCWQLLWCTLILFIIHFHPEVLNHIYTGLLHLPGPIEMSSSISQSKAPSWRFPRRLKMTSIQWLSSTFESAAYCV
jgi:hypothetical protein